jgi:putative cell wall-binding protein
VLLTPQAGLAATTRTALTTLRTNGATRVTIVGGPPPSGRPSRRDHRLGFTVTRLGGADRFRTAELVVAAGEGASASNVGIVASGISTVDALAAGPLAFKGKHPVFLTRAASIPASTLAAMRAAGVTSVYIVGGEAVVSANVRTQLTAAGITVVGRLAGQTRSGTSVAIADAIIGSTFGFTNTTFNVASGARDGVDALSGAALSGLQSRPILITDTDTNAGAVIEFATRRSAQLNAPGIIFGGFAACRRPSRRPSRPLVALSSRSRSPPPPWRRVATSPARSPATSRRSPCPAVASPTRPSVRTTTHARLGVSSRSRLRGSGRRQLRRHLHLHAHGWWRGLHPGRAGRRHGGVRSRRDRRPGCCQAQIVSTGRLTRAREPGPSSAYVFDEPIGDCQLVERFRLYQSDVTKHADHVGVRADRSRQRERRAGRFRGRSSHVGHGHGGTTTPT